MPERSSDRAVGIHGRDRVCHRQELVGDGRRVKKPSMLQTRLYPLRFEPIYQYRLWGGRRLADLLNVPLPNDGPFGEAWVLSDREDHQSRVADGALQGRTIGQLLEQSPEQLLGKLSGRFRRFPLLLKFLDAREMLSVQVHPSDAHQDLIPPGETGKTEAWVVLEAGKESRIYAGLKPGTNSVDLRHALTNGRSRTTSSASRRGPAMPSSCRQEQFTLWAVTSWCSKCKRTAM
jgi:Phosphomannose isomerase type I